MDGRGNTCETFTQREMSYSIHRIPAEEASSDVDRKSSLEPALHVHRAGNPHSDCSACGDPPYPDGHLSKHRYPGDLDRVAIYRPEPRGARRPVDDAL